MRRRLFRATLHLLEVFFPTAPDDLMAVADAAGVTAVPERPNRGIALAEAHIAEAKAKSGIGRQPGFTPATYRRVDDLDLWAFELATRDDGYDPTVLPGLLTQMDRRTTGGEQR